jgi:hypothetical protein
MEVTIRLFLLTAASAFMALQATAQVAPEHVRTGPFPKTPANVHLEMVFNYNMGGDYGPETNVVDQVWGADLPDQPPKMYNSAYIPFDVDDFLNDVTWYQQNHADWLVYQCDRKTLAYVPGSDRAPLDFANPDVRAYQWQNWVDAKLMAHYQSIAVDLLSLSNAQGRCGHFDASGQHWVKEYSGNADDKKFRRDVLQWEALTYQHVHAASMTATMQVNTYYVYDTPFDDQNLALMTTTDLLFDERGFTEFGGPPNVPTPEHWLVIADKLDAVQSKGICYMTNGEEPGTNDDITQAETEWVVGNYLLFRKNCTFMYMTGVLDGMQYYGYLVQRPEYAMDLGKYRGDRFQTQGVWERNYAKGLVIVNPSASQATVTLPSGHWFDVNRNRMGATVSLAHQTALVLTNH